MLLKSVAVNMGHQKTGTDLTQAQTLSVIVLLAKQHKFNMSKKGVALTTETLVIVILSVLALLVILFFFSSGWRQIVNIISSKIGEVLGLWGAAKP